VTRYREICADLAGRIRSGELTEGAELPGVRELASRGVALGIVLAYLAGRSLILLFTGR